MLEFGLNFQPPTSLNMTMPFGFISFDCTALHSLHHDHYIQRLDKACAFAGESRQSERIHICSRRWIVDSFRTYSGKCNMDKPTKIPARGHGSRDHHQASHAKSWFHSTCHDASLNHRTTRAGLSLPSFTLSIKLHCYAQNARARLALWSPDSCNSDSPTSVMLSLLICASTAQMFS